MINNVSVVIFSVITLLTPLSWAGSIREGIAAQEKAQSEYYRALKAQKGPITPEQDKAIREKTLGKANAEFKSALRSSMTKTLIKQLGSLNEALKEKSSLNADKNKDKNSQSAKGKKESDRKTASRPEVKTKASAKAKKEAVPIMDPDSIEKNIEFDGSKPTDLPDGDYEIEFGTPKEEPSKEEPSHVETVEF